MKLFDIVTLIEDLPELKLYRGQVGTIVEQYDPQNFEIEFSDMKGRTYALETLKEEQLIVLLYQPCEEREKLSA